jgi:hypothetical protein
MENPSIYVKEVLPDGTATLLNGPDWCPMGFEDDEDETAEEQARRWLDALGKAGKFRLITLVGEEELVAEVVIAQAKPTRTEMTAEQLAELKACIVDKAEPGKMYLHLFHGRMDPEEDMEDWGDDGPLFGPLQYAHVTYCSDIKLEMADGRQPEWLRFHEDMVEFDGVYYGDWSVYLGEEEKPPTERKRK